jgi:ribosome maturation factor RimP
MDLKEKISEIAQQALQDAHHFLVDVVVSSKLGPGKITVIMDGDHGVTIDDCAAVSRAISKSLDEQAVIADSFTLEVTTPGVDQPLKMKRQFIRNIGRGLSVRTKTQKVERGTLIAVHDDSIGLALSDEGDHKHKKAKTEGATIVLPFSEIEKATVQISFK